MKKTLLLYMLIFIGITTNCMSMLPQGNGTRQIEILTDGRFLVDEETEELNRLYVRNIGFFKDLNPVQKLELVKELKEITDKYNRVTVDDTCSNICIGAIAGIAALGLGALIFGNM
ncbi:MAG: hypothetical protein ABIF12_03670 [bacterium]